jgi:hypothetical protein
MSQGNHRTARLGAALLAASLCGCVVNEHRVGLGATGSGSQSMRQYYILFGLFRTNEVDVQRLASDLTSYTIRSEYSWFDLLIQPLLLPLTMTSRTVTVDK